VQGQFVDGNLYGLKNIEMLQRVIEKAGEYNIIVMLDMHRSVRSMTRDRLWRT
jgi:aryl-phospho-beta-D-glucosidase BglC (GH1 family)